MMLRVPVQGRRQCVCVWVWVRGGAMSEASSRFASQWLRHAFRAEEQQFCRISAHML